MALNGKEALTVVSHKLGNHTQKKKFKRNPGSFWTLQALCEKAGLSTLEFEENVKDKLDRVVSQVCRYGDRFTKNCICVQLYDDTDEIMKKAAAAGALVCITDHKIEGIPCIVLKNTYKAYSDLCSFYRTTFNIKSTVIAGSIGKTTAKKMVAAVYNQAYKTLCDTGNDNILDSIGYICQHIPKNHTQLVAELSEDTPGLISEMSKIAKPNIAIITTIDKSHIQFYGSEESIFNEFRSITKHMPDDGVCIISLDQPNAKTLITDKKVIYVSIENHSADFTAINITVNSEGTQFQVIEKSSGKIYPVKLFNTFAIHNVTSALYAFAAGVVCGIAPAQIIKGLSTYRATGIRQNIYKSGNTVIYADCYNAVAKSIRSAISASCQIPIKGKRIAVIGDVAEAGDYTESTHDEIVDIINSSSIDVLLTCGTETKKALNRKRTRNDLLILTFDSQKKMNQAIKKQVKNGDMIVFKASHSGNLQNSIAHTFPFSYFIQSIKYYIPRIKWHFKVILN